MNYLYYHECFKSNHIDNEIIQHEYYANNLRIQLKICFKKENINLESFAKDYLKIMSYNKLCAILNSKSNDSVSMMLNVV